MRNLRLIALAFLLVGCSSFAQELEWRSQRAQAEKSADFAA